MRWIRCLCLAALAATAMGCVVYGQVEPNAPPPGYGQPPEQPPYGQPPGQPPEQPPYGQPPGSYPYDQVSGDDARNDVGFFYDELSPYGEWVQHPRWGWVWFPRQVPPGWRPYWLGHWALTEFGWTWVSEEPFGWATYHYGRWVFDPEFGWLWVPGTVWGPAWVAWQSGAGFIGWAPLPPNVGFELGIGLRLGGIDLSVAIDPFAYCFVEERAFLDPRLATYVLPRARNVTIIRSTTNITNYTVVNNQVVNQGVPVTRIEQATGRRVERLRVAAATAKGVSRVEGNQVTIYRPPQAKLQTVRVAAQTNAGKPAPPSRRRPAPTPPPTGGAAAGVRPQGPAVRTPITAVAPPVNAVTQQEVQRRHQEELKSLQAHQEAERKRLEQIHQQEQGDAKANANAAEMAQRHAAEMKALEEQHARAAQQLKSRQQLEEQAAKASEAKGKKPEAKPTPKPKPTPTPPQEQPSSLRGARVDPIP